MVTHRKLVEKVQSYLTKTQHTKMEKHWRKLGYFSESDYVRDLIRNDMRS
jgi:hypothetical protein